MKGPDVLSQGEKEYVSNGPLESAIMYVITLSSAALSRRLAGICSYLDGGANGPCSHDGLQCSMVEITLKNGANGASSSADISLIPE